MTDNRRNIMILFFTLVVVMMGFGMAIPILPFYIEAFGGSGSDMGFLMAIYAIMQFLFAPVWGQLSDRYGRKPIILIGVLGNAIAQLLFGLSSALWMLFVARALAGVLSSATLPTAMAYIGDSTSEEDRGGGMGIMGAAMGVGMVLGPGLGGLLAKEALSLPFFLAAALSAGAFLLILAVLPESLPANQRAAGEGGLRSVQVGEMGRALFSPIGFLLLMAFLLSFGLTNFETIFSFYSKDRYGYGPADVGVILMVIGVISAVVQGGLTGPLSRRWGEANLLRGALLISGIGFLLMLLAENLAGVLVTVSIFIVGNALLRPATASLISRRTVHGQGVAMGLNNAFMSLGRIAGPLWAGAIYDVQISYPYISGAIVMLIGFGLSMAWLSRAPVEASIDAPASAPEPGVGH